METFVNVDNHQQTSTDFLLKEAERSIRFYYNLRRVDEDKKCLDSEIRRLKFICDNPNNGDPFKGFNKSIGIGVILVGLRVFGGVLSITNHTNYTEKIFRESGSSLSPTTALIVVGGIQLFGAFIATNAIDRLGRKVFLFCF